MLIGYARVSKADGSQSVDMQTDALRAAGVGADAIYTDFISGKSADREGLTACLKALRAGDTLVIWKLDRLGRSLADLVQIANDLAAREIGLRVLAGAGALIDTSTPAGRLSFGIFAALAEFERELIRERTIEGLKAARARGRSGGRPRALTKHRLLFAQVALREQTIAVPSLCKELGISKSSLYRYLSPAGELRAPAIALLQRIPNKDK